MSLNSYNSTTGELTKIAGGLLYADVPVGTIQAYGSNTIPSGWLLCNGQAVSRTTYAELFAIIGTNFGTGDGSTTFNVPDLRETAPVGSGTRGNGVTTHDTYTVGQFKDDQLQNHKHDTTSTGKLSQIYTASAGDMGSGDVLTLTGRWDSSASNKYTVTKNISVSGTSGNPSTDRRGAVTRGKRLGVNYIIKVKQIGVPADIAAGVDTLIANAITEALAIKTITPTIEAAGTSVTCVRSGKAVMVHVHNDTVSVSFNTRVNLASGLPKPAGNIIPTGLNDWGGITTNVSVELSASGTLMAVGATGTSSTNVTVDSTFTYITSE